MPSDFYIVDFVLSLTLYFTFSFSNFIISVFVCTLSHSVVSDFVTPWTVASQAPLSTEFSRQEYCNVLPFPSSGTLPVSGTESWSPALQTDSLPYEPGKPWSQENQGNLGIFVKNHKSF